MNTWAELSLSIANGIVEPVEIGVGSRVLPSLVEMVGS